MIDKVATAGEANFNITANERITANTSLEPFYDSSGTRFWNSTDVKTSTPFGYAYPETQRWLYPSDQAYQTAVRNAIVSMYGANTVSNFFATMAPQQQAQALDGQDEEDELPYHEEEEGREQHPKEHSARHRHNHGDGHGHKHEHRNKHQQNSSHGHGGGSEHEHSQHQNHSPNRSHCHKHHRHGRNPNCGGHVNEHTPCPDCGDFPINPGHPSGHGNHPNSEPEEPADILPPDEPIPTMDVIPPEYGHIVHPDNTYTEWITNIRALKHGLGQTFRVYVFLGDFNHDPTTWATEYNVVGRFTALGRGHNHTQYAPHSHSEAPDRADPSSHSHIPPRPEPSPPSPPPDRKKCHKCKVDADEDLHIAGSVPLTTALLQDIVEGKLHSLDKDDVEPYLHKNMHWRVTLIDGTEIPRENVPALKVGVVSTKVKILEDGMPEHTDEYECHPLITDGRPGGFCGGDDM